MNYIKSFDETRINYDLYTLNPSDSISLIEIGNKFPLYDGSVVFEARIMYGATYGLDYQFTDACEIDSTRGEKRLSQNIGDNSIDEEINFFIEDAKVSLYPNPSKGEFYVNNPNLCEIEIFDLLGRKVEYTKSIINDNLSLINLTCINGIYNVVIKDLNGVTINKIEVLK